MPRTRVETSTGTVRACDASLTRGTVAWWHLRDTTVLCARCIVWAPPSVRRWYDRFAVDVNTRCGNRLDDDWGTHDR